MFIVLLRKDCLSFSNLYVHCINFISFLQYIFAFVLYFFLFKWLCCLVTLLYAVGLERITPNTYISMYARTNRCYNERGSKTNYFRSSIPHYS